MSVTSKFSPLEIAQNTETGVQCATLEYKSDCLSTDHRCTACMKCTTSQPEEDVELRFRWPGAKVLTERVPLVALILWAVFPIDHVLGDAVEGTALIASLFGVLAPIAAYLVSTTATLGFEGTCIEGVRPHFALMAASPYVVTTVLASHG